MKYFNKSFFRFAFGFLAIVAVGLLIIVAASAYATGVEKIAFTTEIQIINPNKLSGPITIQTQDAGGSSSQTPETLDLEFTSTSPTGEFLGSTGNPVTTTMGKNTANRTFYYRDSAEGTFTLTVKATGRDSGQTWSASQKINVGSSGNSGNQNDEDDGEILGVSTNTQTSATSGSVAPTYSIPSSQLEVSAGGDRLTTPGSPINLQVLIKKNSSSNSSLSFSWSFGDGNVGEGALVTHMYKYPGEYAVVLNAKSGNNFAVARLKVKVAESNLKIKEENGYVEITNDSNTEINLFNWKLTSGHQSFIFQPDTIILPKSSVKFDKSMLKLKSSEDPGLVLKDFTGQVVAIADTQVLQSVSDLVLYEIMPQNSTPIVYVKDRSSVEPEVLGASVQNEETNVIYESMPEGFFARAWRFLMSVVD